VNQLKRKRSEKHDKMIRELTECLPDTSGSAMDKAAFWEQMFPQANKIAKNPVVSTKLIDELWPIYLQNCQIPSVKMEKSDSDEEGSQKSFQSSLSTQLPEDDGDIEQIFFDELNSVCGDNHEWRHIPINEGPGISVSLKQDKKKMNETQKMQFEFKFEQLMEEIDTRFDDSKTLRNMLLDWVLSHNYEECTSEVQEAFYANFLELNPAQIRYVQEEYYITQNRTDHLAELHKKMMEIRELVGDAYAEYRKGAYNKKYIVELKERLIEDSEIEKCVQRKLFVTWLQGMCGKDLVQTKYLLHFVNDSADVFNWDMSKIAASLVRRCEALQGNSGCKSKHYSGNSHRHEKRNTMIQEWKLALKKAIEKRRKAMQTGPSESWQGSTNSSFDSGSYRSYE